MTTCYCGERNVPLFTVCPKCGRTAMLGQPPPPEPYFEFYSYAAGPCGCCGNTGVINTIGHVRSPAGVACGVLRWCFCPNGRAWKARAGTVAPTEAEARQLTAPVGT